MSGHALAKWQPRRSEAQWALADMERIADAIDALKCSLAPNSLQWRAVEEAEAALDKAFCLIAKPPRKK